MPAPDRAAPLISDARTPDHARRHEPGTAVASDTGATGLGIAGVLAFRYPAVIVLLAAGLLGERIATGQRAGIGTCSPADATLALG